MILMHHTLVAKKTLIFTELNIWYAYGNRFTIYNNDDVVPYGDNDKHMTPKAAQQQINAILTGYITAYPIKELTDQAKHCDVFFMTKNSNHTLPIPPSPLPTYAKNNDHDV